MKAGGCSQNHTLPHSAGSEGLGQQRRWLSLHTTSLPSPDIFSFPGSYNSCCPTSSPIAFSYSFFVTSLFQLLHFSCFSTLGDVSHVLAKSGPTHESIGTCTPVKDTARLISPYSENPPSLSDRAAPWLPTGMSVYLLPLTLKLAPKSLPPFSIRKSHRILGAITAVAGKQHPDQYS